MIFKALADNESPMLGLFFLESEENLDPRARVHLAVDRPLAAGMASLISEDGIVSTCSHVILALDVRPGMRVSLFGATASVSVEVIAEVLAEGWRGPLLDDQGARTPSPFWNMPPRLFCAGA